MKMANKVINNTAKTIIAVDMDVRDLKFTGSVTLSVIIPAHNNMIVV